MCTQCEYLVGLLEASLHFTMSLKSFMYVNVNQLQTYPSPHSPCECYRSCSTYYMVFSFKTYPFLSCPPSYLHNAASSVSRSIDFEPKPMLLTRPHPLPLRHLKKHISLHILLHTSHYHSIHILESSDI